MSFTFVQATNQSSGKSRAFTEENVTAGSVLVLCLRNADGSNAVTGVSDDVNGAWTQAETVGPDGDGNSLEMWYYLNAGAGSTTVTVAGAMSDASIRFHIAEYSTTHTATDVALIDSNSATQGAGSTTCSSGTASNTGTDGDVLAVGGMVCSSDLNATAGGTGSTFTARGDVTAVRTGLQDDTTAASGNSESAMTISSAAYTLGGICLFGVLTSSVDTPILVPTGPLR